MHAAARGSGQCRWAVVRLRVNVVLHKQAVCIISTLVFLQADASSAACKYIIVLRKLHVLFLMCQVLLIRVLFG